VLEFVLEPIQGGGAHGQGRAMIAYGLYQDVSIQASEVLEGNQDLHDGRALAVGCVAHIVFTTGHLAGTGVRAHLPCGHLSRTEPISKTYAMWPVPHLVHFTPP
jgi:hypothetical protein